MKFEGITQVHVYGIDRLGSLGYNFVPVMPQPN